jgi:hypothetical protein
MQDKGPALALLIDGDSASPKIVAGLLAEVAKYGVASVRRIYGDWTKPNLNGWKATLLEHSVQPVQQFAYTTGKNATDGAMIIDAMDLLYTQRFDGFCIVSSDSDFARLASRIREQGVTVYGFGERKTPHPFVKACDKFIYSDLLIAPDEPRPAPEPTRGKSTEAKRLRDPKLVNMLRNAIDALADDAGWASLSRIGAHLSKQSPDFDQRSHGFARLSDLIEATGLVETKRDGEGGRQILARIKPRGRSTPARGDKT